jgi:hypothetical protein
MKQTADNNRDKIIPDKLKNGIRDYMMRAEERNHLYEFIALYVQKVSNTLIMRELHCMTGCSFLDFIRPDDIAYVIALVKNGSDCRKLPRYVLYKCTYVPYNGTFGMSDQGQRLDVGG